MFYGCSSLISVDLSNFNISEVEYMDYMFYGCENLQYINLEKYNESNYINMNNILYLVPENILFCLNKDNNISQIMKIINEKNCYNISCDNDWKSYQNKLIAENNTCIDNCSEYEYEKDNKCYNKLTPEAQNEIIYQKIINYSLLEISK